MKVELILKFIFEASHSLAGHEIPHPHLWRLEVAVGGSPVQGKILDIVALRAQIESLLEKVKLTYLNENQAVTKEVRDFPTCETLSQFFWNEIHVLLEKKFLHENPTAHLQAVTVGLAEMNGEEMGAVRLAK